MKKVIFLSLLSVLLATAGMAQQAIINGEFNTTKEVENFYLFYASGEERIEDSARLKDGKFQFKVKIDEPTMATLAVKYADANGEGPADVDRMAFFIEPGTITITAKDSLENAKVAGSESNSELEKINELLEPFTEKEKTLYAQYTEYNKAKDEEGMKKVSAEYDLLSDERNEKVFGKYVKENPKSPIALYVLNQYAGYSLDPVKVSPLFETLPASTRNSESGIAFNERIETAKKTAVGAMAIEFTQNDTLDKPVSLSSFRGKYVLVDFWASWCGPCRAENPNVVKAFNDYKDKGFTVLGVSLDQPGKKQAWLNAIHKDGLTWTQLSDLNGWKNEVAVTYGIRSIPQNFLIDPNGKIIAKNIRGEELQTKLAELIK